MSRHVPTFVVEKSPLIREGLTRILAGARFKISVACSDLREIGRKAAPGDEALILFGSDAQGSDDFSELRRFKTEHPAARIVMLSDSCNAQHLMKSIEAGADAYLSKQITGEALLKSLDLVWMGETVITSAFLSTIFLTQPEADAPETPAPDREVDHLPAPEPASSGDIGFNRLQRLSCKEQLIMQCLTRGASNKAIARELNMAEATVKVHIKGILRKIRVTNRTQAAVWALDRDRNALVEGNA